MTESQLTTDELVRAAHIGWLRHHTGAGEPPIPLELRPAHSLDELASIAWAVAYYLTGQQPSEGSIKGITPRAPSESLLPALPAPSVRCGDYAGPAGEGASENLWDADQMTAYGKACAASALRSTPATVPAGWKLVPEQLTETMLKAGGHANSEWLNDMAPMGEQRYTLPIGSVWKAMLAAAPTPPAAPVQGASPSGPRSPLQPPAEASAAIVGAKTQARHAIELIADWYEANDEGHRAVVARRSQDSQLLDVIKSVLQDLANTEAAYMNEKGNSRQLDEIARLRDELKTAKSPQADAVAALNKRLIAANEEIDTLRMQLARGIEADARRAGAQSPVGNADAPRNEDEVAQPAPAGEPSGLTDDDLTTLLRCAEAFERIASKTTQTSDDRLFAATRPRRMTINDAASLAECMAPALRKLHAKLYATPSVALAAEVEQLRAELKEESDFGAAIESALDDYPMGGPHVERVKQLVAFYLAHAPASTVRIRYEPVGRCFWHDCTRLGSPMAIEKYEVSRSLLRCVVCGVKGWYPVGKTGDVECAALTHRQADTAGGATSDPSRAE